MNNSLTMQTKKTSQNRVAAFDILRILACLMIVAMHAPLPGGEEDGLFISSLSYLTAPGIGLFFMISGALLLPVNETGIVFLRRRSTKIAIPTIIWTLLYLLFKVHFKGDSLTLRALLSVPFSAQGTPVFWFIYTLLGLYLLAPVLSHWLRVASRRELEFYLLLWVVSLGYPVLKFIADINTSHTGILYYFTGYAGYFLLGYYLKTYPDRIAFRWVIPAMLVALVVPIFCKLKDVQVDFYDLFWYLSIFVAVQCVFWWKLICCASARFEGRAFPILTAISKRTFGIYLVHIFIMRYLLWNWDFIVNLHPFWLQTLVIVVLTFAGSLAVSYLISLLPFSKYLVGT